jgi:flagellar biosynthesis/type III secretory pathway M-ring protein FliF/YscJ
MVEMDIKMPDYLGDYTETSLKATETNMWNADFFGALYNNLVYIVAGIVIAIFLITLVVVLRRKKTPPTPKPATTDTPPPPPPRT